MENNVISRREFFKGAAKKALPILGAVALMSMPNVLNAATAKATSCEYGCYGSCESGCEGSCVGACSGCTGTCSGTCSGTCYGSSK